MRMTKYDTRLNEDRLPILIKEASINYKVTESMTTPPAIVKYFNEIEDLDILTEEKIFMICFNTNLKPIGTFEIAHGTVSQCRVSTRDIYMKALAIGAVFIAIVHNHPAGDPKFSKEDISTAKEIKLAGEYLDIKLIDFIAIGSNNQYQSLEALHLL